MRRLTHAGSSKCGQCPSPWGSSTSAWRGRCARRYSSADGGSSRSLRPHSSSTGIFSDPSSSGENESSTPAERTISPTAFLSISCCTSRATSGRYHGGAWYRRVASGIASPAIAASNRDSTDDSSASGTRAPAGDTSTSAATLSGRWIAYESATPPPSELPTSTAGRSMSRS